MGFAKTDRGNAARLVRRFGDVIKYIPTWGAFLSWEGDGWRVDRGGLAALRYAGKTVDSIRKEGQMEPVGSPERLALMKWAVGSENRTRLEAMVNLARVDLAISYEQLDRSPFLLNCVNGTVDLRSGKLRPHAPSDLLTKSTGVVFRTAAKAPQWERFLKQVLPDAATREFIQRFAGYATTGDVSERMFAILHGKGRNGKSLFLHMIKRALGDYASVGAPELLMADKGQAHPTDVADLYGVRLAIANEVRKGRTFDEEAVKRLTGGDTLKARRMREDFWEFSPTHKLMIAANHTPNVKDASDSFWDRVALIPFNVRITDKQVDRRLIDKLSKELPGILAWLVRGAVLWHRSGLKRPKAVVEATTDYRAEEDKLGQFFLEKLRVRTDGKLKSSTLRALIAAWCKDRCRPFPEKDVVERLRSLGCQPIRVGSGKTGTMARAWGGIEVAS